MKLRIITIIFVTSSLIAGCLSQNDSINENEEMFKIKKGLNVSHWLSQSTKRGIEREKYMSAKDFKVIADMGFDHIRIPIDEEQMWDDEGNKQIDAFQIMHNAIKWSFENDLKVIVDLHVIRSHHFNNPNNRELWEDKKAQEDFIKFWNQLSEELNKYPNSRLAYEPLNEAVAEKPEEWNKLINWVISEIRELEPERTIIMGSNRWQTVGTFKDLEVPENDPNIMLSFHYYEPMIITHYKASWSSIKDLDVPVHYPGPHISPEDYEKMDQDLAEKMKSLNQNFDLAAIDNEIKQAVDVAKKYGLKLYCGEFGCFPSTDLSIRQNWYKDMMTVFDKYNIAWTHWNYKNDFPVVDENMHPIKGLIEILIPEKK